MKKSMENKSLSSKSFSRIMIAGTNSGCGKTTITCGILKALMNKGLKVASFKCGPDYIDPMFHSEIIGAKARNLCSPCIENSLKNITKQKYLALCPTFRKPQLKVDIWGWLQLIKLIF